jgi:hypothetical protein
MPTFAIKQPRRIDPSLVEIGDDISITLKPERGITTTLRGIVGKRIDVGATRYMMTDEGATLFAWEAKRTVGLTITLYGRSDCPQTSLFELEPEVEKRIA